MDKSFPNMGKEIVTQVQEVQRVPCIMNPRRSTLRYMLIKLTKIKYKEKITKSARKKQQTTCKETPHKDNSQSFNKNSAGQKGMAGYT